MLIDENRQVWLHLATGEIKLGGQILKAGDSAAISEETWIAIAGVTESELLLFDLGLNRPTLLGRE